MKAHLKPLFVIAAISSVLAGSWYLYNDPKPRKHNCQRAGTAECLCGKAGSCNCDGHRFFCPACEPTNKVGELK